MRMQYFLNKKCNNLVNISLIILTTFILALFFQFNIENIYFDTSDNLRRFQQKEAFYYKFLDFNNYKEFFLYQLYIYLIIFFLMSMAFKSYILFVLLLIFFFKDMVVYIHLFDQMVASFFLIFSLLKLQIKNQLVSIILILIFHFQSLVFYLITKIYQLLLIYFKNHFLTLFVFLFTFIFILIFSDYFFNVKYNAISLKSKKIFDSYSLYLFLTISIIFFSYLVIKLIFEINDNNSFGGIFIFFIFVTMIGIFLNISEEWYYRVVFWIRYCYFPILFFFLFKYLSNKIKFIY